LAGRGGTKRQKEKSALFPKGGGAFSISRNRDTGSWSEELPFLDDPETRVAKQTTNEIARVSRAVDRQKWREVD